MLNFIGELFWFWVTGALVNFIVRLDKDARLKRLQMRGLGWNPEHVASLLSVIDPLDAGSRKKARALYHDVATEMVASCPLNEQHSPADIESAYSAALGRLGEYPPALNRRTPRLVARLHAAHALSYRNWHAETW